MFGEAISGFNAARNRYATESAGSVVERTSDALGNIVSSFSSLDSICDSARNNIRSRTARARRDRNAAEARRRRLEAICARHGIRPPARRKTTGGNTASFGGAGVGTSAAAGSGPTAANHGQSSNQTTSSASHVNHTGTRMTPEDKNMAEEFAAAFAALGDIRAELERAEKTLADIKRLQDGIKELAVVSARFLANASGSTVDTGKLESFQRNAEQLSSNYQAIASECSGTMANLAVGGFSNTLRDLRELRGEIEQAKRNCPGQSKMATELLDRINVALDAMENAESRFEPLGNRIETVVERCKGGSRQWSEKARAAQQRLVSERKRSGEMAKDLARLTALVNELSELLSRLSGKPAAAFRGTKRIGALSVPELARVSEVPPIVEQAKKARRDRLNALGDLFRRTQRHPDELKASDLNATHAIPRHIVCGDAATMALGGGTLLVPIAGEFPFQAPLRFANADDIPSFLLRLLYAMPVGGVRITAIDCARHGECVLPLNELGRDAGILKVVANANDFAPAMDAIVEEMGAMARDRFSATMKNWAQFNAANPGAPLPLHILAVFSVDALDSYSRAIGSLANILETGAKFGVLCLVAKTALDDLDERQRKTLDTIRMADMPLTLAGAGLPSCPGLGLRPIGMGKASDAFVGERVADYVKAIAKRNERPVKSFLNLFEDVDFWRGDSTPGISATIGWDANGAPVAFELGVGRGLAAVHALVGGTTGSGKSVLLHTLIQSLAGKYSPDELQFYLLDYKNGDEFKKYADDRGDAWLPHVRMIARHRDPRFALELFDFLDHEIKRRSQVFGNYGDIIAYRRNGGKIPRILIIIDEFQVMFENYCGQDLSESVAKRLATVFKQGRAYGVHVVLATQSLRSMTFKGMGGILGQVAMRVALYGQKEDGILADNNSAATRITPKRQCIVNPSFGANDSPGVVNNLVADVPFSDPAQVDECKKFKALVVKTARDRRIKSACRVFNGAVLPDPPASEVVNEALKPEKWNVLFPVLLGARTDFSSTPFTVSFTANPREHLLVAGEDGNLVEGAGVPITGEAIWEGIRRGLIRSFRPLRSCEVLWYDPTVPDVPNGLPDWFIAVGGRAKEAELLAAFHELASAKAERKIVVVENFQDAMLLHPADAPRPSFGPKPAPPPPETARSLFTAAFSGLETPPFHAILMTRNFGYLHRKVFSRTGAEVNLLEACGKRVAFNLAPEVQDVVVPGLSFDAKRGPRRVWFGDVNTGKTVDFLPYSRTF